MLGAEGAWVGTAFLATDEAGIEDFQKQAIAEGGDGDTVVSRSITGTPARMIANKWANAWIERSEEHTSDLQSLLRISYAVFCLQNTTLSDWTNITTLT